MTGLQMLPDGLDPVSPGPGRNGRIKITPSFAIQVIGWIIAVAMIYGTFDKRLAVLEDNRSGFERRLMSIENKVDQLLSRPR